MAYDSQTEYEDGDADYPWAPHVGSRFNSPGRNFSYGAQPSAWSNDFGDRASRLFVYTPQQINLTLAGFLGGSAQAPSLARAAVALGRQGATGTLTVPVTIGAGETGVLAFLQTFNGASHHTISGIAGGGSWSLVDFYEIFLGTETYRVEWWATAPGAATATSSVVVSFAVTSPWVEGCVVWPLANVGSFGNIGHNTGTSLAESVAVVTQDNDNIVLAMLWNSDSASVVNPNVGTLDLRMFPGNTADFYSLAMHHTRTTPGSLTISATDTGTNAWAAAGLEIRGATGGPPLSGAVSTVLTPGGLSKVLAGGLTFIGDMTKQVNRSLAGGFTPGGAVTKLVNRALAGGFTPAGALTWARQYLRTLAGGFTPSGALTKLINRILAGGFVPSATVTKQTNRNLAGGSVPSGALSKRTSSTLAGGIAPAGTLQKLVARILTGAVTFTGILTKATIYLRTLAGGFTPSGTVTKQTNRNLAGGSVPSGALTKRTFRNLAGGIVPAGALQKIVARILAGAVTFTGILTKTTVYLRTFAGGFTPSGALTKQTNRAVAGSTVPSGTLTKRTFRNLAGLLAPSGTLSKFLTKLLAGSVAPSGTLTALKAYFKTFAGALVPSGTVQRQTARATQGAIAPSGAVSRRTFRTLIAQMGLSGQFSRIVKKNLGGFILPTGVLTRQAIGHDFLILLAGTEGARYIIGALNAIRYRLENRSESRYGPSHTGEASDELDNNSTSKDDL